MSLGFTLMLLLGVTPSFVWLFFFLKEDSHPEPRLWITLAFLGGAGIVPLVFFTERAAINAANAILGIPREAIATNILFMFLGVALIEELAKFFVVRVMLSKNPVFDEPVDAMIYMITAALGFAALENIILLLGSGRANLYGEAIQIMSLRLIGANFLHALSSGIVGFAWAVSLFARNAAKKYAVLGIGIAGATALHGIFNVLILKLGGAYLFPATFLLFVVGLVVLHNFDILKTLRAPIKPR